MTLIIVADGLTTKILEIVQRSDFRVSSLTLGDRLANTESVFELGKLVMESPKRNEELIAKVFRYMEEAIIDLVRCRNFDEVKRYVKRYYFLKGVAYPHQPQNQSIN